jgi:mono/diheme cytochrome c family protein
MPATLLTVGSGRRSRFRRMRPAAILVLLASAAACGGDRGKLASAGDTSGVANRAAATDTASPSSETAATPVADSTKAPKVDSSHATPTPSDSAARRTAARAADTTRKRPKSAGPRPAKRVATASQDTRARASDTASQAKPDSGAQQADTGKAKPDSGTAKSDTSTVQGGELRDAYHQAPRDTVSETVYDGWKQFNLNCARCHGEDVTGTTIAPHLVVSLRPDGPINTKELFVQTVCAGRPAKGMPAWCTLGLGMDKIQDIYSYVKGRSDGKIAPGRPAVRKGA